MTLSSVARRMRDLLRRLFERRRPEADPFEYAGVAAPASRGPKGRSGAVAVPEPDED